MTADYSQDKVVYEVADTGERHVEDIEIGQVAFGFHKPFIAAAYKSLNGCVNLYKGGVN